MSNLELAGRLQQTLAELDGQQVTSEVLKELVRLDALDCTSPRNTGDSRILENSSVRKDLDSTVSDA